LWDNRSLADGIEAAAARRPDAVALADNDGRLSYAILARALATAAAALAGHAIIPLEAFDGGDDQPEVSLQPKVPLPREDRDHVAVLLFSSGTTGRPKGVLHSLNTLTAGAANMARITSANQDTVCYLVAPLTSITGLMQVHLAADVHATLVLEDQFAPQESLQRMNAAGATLLGGAPVIAERLLHAAMASPGTGWCLRTLALGGAMLPRPLLELATESFGIKIARVYGSSEAPNFTGSLPGDDREARLSDDGALMPGSEVRVGTAGHQARLTVVGRLTEVVNRNGLKISLPEADAALEGLPGAEEYSSFGMPDERTGERLAVAVRLAGGASLTLADVVAYLLGNGVARRKLPEQLVRWDGPLPRTPSGKIVRSRLVMESPAKDSDLASRLLRAPADEEGTPTS
jgi:acyl-CoA synthetase (AMP-forming)/AMP-acid ligase II